MAVCWGLVDPVAAADQPPIEHVVVVGTTPLPGTGVDRDKLPQNIQTLSADDIDREGPASATRALQNTLGSVSINDNLDNPFQPDILFRGFEASPVLGTPQGLAVFENGVRINEAFGDSVNWDFVPSIAIKRIDLISENPVYGLNALGGAVIVSMKNGFNAPGAHGEVSGGSFGRWTASGELGTSEGNFAAYIAGTWLDEDGWREFSPSSLRQLYGDLTYRTETASIDLSFTGADNHLSGESPAPVQELAVDRALVFTSPQSNIDRLSFVTLNGALAVTETLSLQANAYYRAFRQNVVNGNTTEYSACSSAPDALCQDDEVTPLIDGNGATIPDLSQGGTIPIGQNDFEAIRSRGTGGTVQAMSIAPIFGGENHFAIGASIDHARTDFNTATEVGVIDTKLRVLPSGFFVVTPEGTDFNATPVSLGAGTTYYGVYATDTLDVTPHLAITASVRWNDARIALNDRLGISLNGDSNYQRVNPAVGATYKLTPSMTAYAGYAEANRTPTPSEIECSDPDHPCLLPSSLSSDPPTLRQVVAHTFEAGVRGAFDIDAVKARVSWNVSAFRTDLDDDIYGVATSLNAGFFQNIEGTRRQGIEAGVNYRDDRFSGYLNYSLVDATFLSPLTLHSPSNPFQDTDGNIEVEAGDRLPGIPRHRVKAGLDYKIEQRITIGGSVVFVSEQFYRGDESNQMSPVPGYALVNLHANYSPTESLNLFAGIENVFDAKYASFGVLGDPAGIGAPGVPANSADADNRFQSPGAPIAAFIGLRAFLR
ncbi:MAG: TonB-dependent receptor [Alphaproteobacteria bacterium]|nr:TonB-dependent receptor [Alphaproteobacteria bacterium]